KHICYTSTPDTDRQKVAQENAWFEARSEVDKNTPRLRRQTTLLTRFDGRGYIERRAQLFLLPGRCPGRTAPDHRGRFRRSSGGLVARWRADRVCGEPRRRRQCQPGERYMDGCRRGRRAAAPH